MFRTLFLKCSEHVAKMVMLRLSIGSGLLRLSSCMRGSTFPHHPKEASPFAHHSQPPWAHEVVPILAEPEHADLVYIPSEFLGRLGQTFFTFFGRGTGLKRSGSVLACFWNDFQAKPSILDPIRAIFDDLGPNRHVGWVLDLQDQARDWLGGQKCRSGI